MDNKAHSQENANRRPITRRRILGASATLLSLPVISKVAAAAGGQILAVRTWPADEYTRVTLELNSPLQAEHFMLGNPNRLVVDIQGLTISQALNSLISKIRPNDPYIAAVRVAQNRADVVRLVFDLKQDIAPQVFTLKPVGDYQYRLVLDLYPKIAKDPILALARDLENDPLAQVLDNLAQNNSTAPVPSVSGQVNPSTAGRQPSRANPNRPILVAIDPGHGGEDPGAIGMRGTREKDIVLAIGRQLRDVINSQPNMRAYMTRESDFFVPLHVRVQKARRVKADLFISIHADAFTNRAARGTSVFALSRNGASSAAARWLAKKENASDLIGGLDIGAHDRQTASVLLDMSTTAQINDSLKIGHRVLGSLAQINGIHSRKVEQAGFAVLKAPDIPSILVETAFISNPQEENFLRSPANQRQIARAIFSGVNDYFSTNPPLARTG
jgi:N-acetylmuramoyl-L-alanine amidase